MTSWFVSDLSGYFVHRLMHTLSLGAHMKHHALYPPDDFLSHHYREPAGLLTYAQMLSYSIPGILYTASVFALFGFHEFLYSVLVVLVYSFVTQYLHNSIHIKGCKLEKFSWFISIRNAHLIHHKTDHNFGIISFLCDRVFGTFKGAQL